MPWTNVLTDEDIASAKKLRLLIQRRTIRNRWAKNNPEKIKKNFDNWIKNNLTKKRANEKLYYKANFEKIRANHRLRKYNLTIEQWNKMFVAQGSLLCNLQTHRTRRSRTLAY